MEKPYQILYIKLGEKGSYEQECVETRGSIKLGYQEIDHGLCSSGKWDEVLQDISEKYKLAQGTATSHRNQIRKFYEEPESTMWISFYNGKLWYCYASLNVEYNPDGTKERKTVSGWKDVDSKNNTLFIQFLSGRLTKVQGYRGTICEIYEKEYLLHKLNNTQSSALATVEKDLQSLKDNLVPLIKKLNPQDFEIFVDLLFRSSGWSRVGTLGKTIKTIDIQLIAPVTNERAVVQVKSQSSLQLFLDYKERLESMEEYEKLFYVTHSPDPTFQKYIDTVTDSEIQIWDAKKLSQLSINAGLIEWIVNVAP